MAGRPTEAGQREVDIGGWAKRPGGRMAKAAGRACGRDNRTDGRGQASRQLEGAGRQRTVEVTEWR